MIAPNIDEKQQVRAAVASAAPLALSGSGGKLYLLLRDPGDELSDFIQTGRTSLSHFQAFTRETEQKALGQFREIGFSISYRSQTIEYMHRKATISYPQASDPGRGIQVIFIPWFLLPGRPYPLFAYAYAAWHYASTGKESLRLSGEAACKIFGISSMDKSTVCRSAKAMEDMLGASALDRPLAVEGRDAAPDAEMAGAVARMLGEDATIGSLEQELGARAMPKTANANPAGAVSRAFSGIPIECSKAYKNSGAAAPKPRDARKRPVRPRSNENGHAQRKKAKFADAAQIERIRIDFIAACRNAALDAATTCRRLLL